MKLESKGPVGSSFDRWIMGLRIKGSRNLSCDYIDWLKERNFKETDKPAIKVTPDIVMAIREGILTREHLDSLYAHYPFLREYMFLSRFITDEQK